MPDNDEVSRIEFSGDGDEIKRFLGDLKRKHPNITKLSNSYTREASTGEGGHEMSFTFRTEEGDMDVSYRERMPSCASIDEAEEMRIMKHMIIKVPQAVYDKGKHHEVLDLTKKWIGDAGIDVEILITNGSEKE
jgi:hypothetical protein